MGRPRNTPSHESGASRSHPEVRLQANDRSSLRLYLMATRCGTCGSMVFGGAWWNSTRRAEKSFQLTFNSIKASLVVFTRMSLYGLAQESDSDHTWLCHLCLHLPLTLDKSVVRIFPHIRRGVVRLCGYNDGKAMSSCVAGKNR